MMHESVVCHKKFEKNTYVNVYKRKTRTVQKFRDGFQNLKGWQPLWAPRRRPRPDFCFTSFPDKKVPGREWKLWWKHSKLPFSKGRNVTLSQLSQIALPRWATRPTTANHYKMSLLCIARQLASWFQDLKNWIRRAQEIGEHWLHCKLFNQNARIDT